MLCSITGLADIIASRCNHCMCGMRAARSGNQHTIIALGGKESKIEGAGRPGAGRILLHAAYGSPNSLALQLHSMTPARVAP